MLSVIGARVISKLIGNFQFVDLWEIHQITKLKTLPKYLL